MDDIFNDLVAYEPKPKGRAKTNVVYATCETLPFKMDVKSVKPEIAEEFGLYVSGDTMVCRLQRMREPSPSTKYKQNLKKNRKSFLNMNSSWEYSQHYADDDFLNTDFVLQCGDKIKFTSWEKSAETKVLEFIPLIKNRYQNKVSVALVLCKFVKGMTFRSAV